MSVDSEMTDVSSPTDYVLSRVLSEHKGEVKSVAATQQGMLLSGGKDETVRMWGGRGGDYAVTLTLPQSPKGSVIYSIAMYEDEEGWKLFVGRKDGAVAVYGSRRGPEPITTFKHHNSVVSCMYVDNKNKKLLTGSWDNHIIIWPIEQIKENAEISASLCEGHSMSVWAVASLEDTPDLILSASADQSIRLWKNDHCEHVFKGHTDVVRALVVLTGGRRFLSAANDFTVRMWGMEEKGLLATWKSPHEEFIYSMASVGCDTIVTCGEGGHIVVWQLQETEEKKNVLTQTQALATPCSSLWCVTGLKNKDFAVAASDGRIFILTRDARRVAAADVRECLDAEMAARLATILQQQEEKENEVVVIKVAIDDGAANLDLKYQKGTDPGLAAEKFITDNSLPMSYLNEITDYIRANVPAARDFRPKRVAGVTGEKHAFEVVVEDGRRLICSFNDGDDPNAVAHTFVEENGLPIKYLISTASMIRRELKSSESQFYDPFTGGGRYVPGASGSFDPNGGADPLTGGGRYVPGLSNGASAGSSGGDPLTSTGRYVPGTGTDLMPNASLPIDKKKPRGELCPLRAFFTFGTESVNAKFYDTLAANNEKTAEAFRLTEAQLQLLKEVAAKGPDFEDTEAVVNSINVGLQWRMDELVPIFDVLRIALLNLDVNGYYSIGAGSADLRPRLLALLVSDSSDALKAFLCRTICNFFAHPSGRTLAAEEMKTLIPVVGSLVLSSKPVVQNAASSALANWAFLLLQTSETVCELGPREDGIREIIRVLEQTTSFGGYREDALTRVLQAISTLMWGDSTVIKLAKSRNIVPIVNRIKDAVVDERSKSLSRDIVEMTYAV